MSNNMGDRRREDRKVVMAFTLVYENGKLLGYLRDLTFREIYPELMLDECTFLQGWCAATKKKAARQAMKLDSSSKN
jgi:hypothetical protein